MFLIVLPLLFYHSRLSRVTHSPFQQNYFNFKRKERRFLRSLKTDWVMLPPLLKRHRFEYFTNQNNLVLINEIEVLPPQHRRAVFL